MITERNETIAILILGVLGALSLYKGNTELASVVVGAIAGYITHNITAEETKNGSRQEQHQKP